MDGTVSFTTGRLAAVIAAAILVGGGGGVAATIAFGPPAAPTVDSSPDGTTDGSIAAFDSADDFRAYIEAGRRTAATGYLGGGSLGTAGGTRVDVAREQSATDGSAPVRTVTPGGSGERTRRISETNVQVGGIDEPDILKTAPDTLFYASQGSVRYAPEPRPVERTTSTDERIVRRGGVHLIDASDPAAPAVASRINATGQLLQVGDTLLVLSGNTLTGYDVSERAAPERVWSTDVEGWVVSARLYEDHVYLVTQHPLDYAEPCPVRPMTDVSIPCTSVHHPVQPVAVETTYAVSVLNPDDGTVDDSTGFVGAAGRSIVYMSPGSVYVTYEQPSDRTELLFSFFIQEQADRLDDETVARLREIRSYDLSERAKRYELQATLQRWYASLEETERRAAREAIQADLQSWAVDNRRRFLRTGIATFDVRGASSASPSIAPGPTGTVPGRPLDQFALDEHEGHLRVATTVDGIYGTDSANDVYVLDGSLEIVGSVQDMGLTERIYSVRFQGEEAYVVTFRRIDPFHVLDLSEPTDPSLEGELKLPGFSSYLHPLGDDRVLGIGEEDGQVKLVVFDVSDPTDPTIESERLLDARWSAVSNTHHAFLLDPRHDVFFLPAGQSGHVYSADGDLERVATVEVDGTARRAAYVGDYLYVFGDRSVTVVDETSWETAGRLSLE